MATARRMLLAAGLVLASGLPVSGAVITVDAGGSGDYLTIQEGVDAAANGDTVLVLPGIYSDTHTELLCYEEVPVNVYFQKNISLMSSAGPGVTIVDGGGTAVYGILAMPGAPSFPPPLVLGFEVRNGGEGWWGGSTGITVINAEARGNVCTGYVVGLATDIWCVSTSVPEGRAVNESVIEANTAYGNDTGIWIVDAPGYPSYDIDATVSTNSIEDNTFGVLAGSEQGLGRWSGSIDLVNNEILGNSSGVKLGTPYSTSSVSLVGNTIAANTNGLEIYDYVSSFRPNISVSVVVDRNRIYSNAWANVIAVASTYSGISQLSMLVGESLSDANDFYGSPYNIRAYKSGTATVTITAPYNYWGSVFCGEFVPRFYLEGVPEANLDYRPYTDAGHATVYPDCETAIPEIEASWGVIKALYR